MNRRAFVAANWRSPLIFAALAKMLLRNAVHRRYARAPREGTSKQRQVDSDQDRKAALFSSGCRLLGPSSLS
jgi:hypothetical protein